MSFLATAAAIHVAPNLAMKAIKSTHIGHKALTGSFSAGLDMGRAGTKLHPNVQDFMEYGAGPESLVEYHLGRKIGSTMRDMSPAEQDQALNSFKGSMLGYLDQMPAASRNEIMKTPVLGTIAQYAQGKGENALKRGMMKFQFPEDGKRKARHYAMNMAALGGAGILEPHALMQPAISAMRKTVGQSKMGQKFMKNGFKNGMDGKVMHKALRGVVDTVVSPSALDPMRLGRTIGKHGGPLKAIMDSNEPFEKIEEIFGQITAMSKGVPL